MHARLARMITLYAFGPTLGLPDPSPFVTKTMTWLRMAGLPYAVNTQGFAKAPKGKLPYIDDDGTIVPDSTLLRWHLENRHGINLDAHLDEERKARNWAIERMLEDHLYWITVHERWIPDNNFRRYFAALPGLPGFLRNPLGARLVQSHIRKSLYAQGTGRHARPDLQQFALRDIDALARLLGQEAWFGGSTVCNLDASAFAFLLGCLCPEFDTPVRGYVQAHANLLAYVQRMKKQYFQDLQ